MTATTMLSAFFLVSGAGVCLIAAIGLVRLPDFFLRMHAATKAGVFGCGLMLLGVGFAEASTGVWLKVLIAIAFLLVTTPIAGHLLGRAGYVAGVPLWGGTSHDQLEGVLHRGQFDLPRTTEDVRRPGPSGRIDQIVVALAQGPDAQAAIAMAVGLAKQHRAPLRGIAVIDTDMLGNVGPVPIGASHHAGQLRAHRIERARRAVAQAVQDFEAAAREARVAFSVAVEEGDPAKILAARRGAKTIMIIGRQGWFDHGVLDGRRAPDAYLVRHGVWPLVSVLKAPPRVRHITFVHDGTPRSDDTLRWLIGVDPWADAKLRLVPHPATSDERLANARQIAAARLAAGAAPTAASAAAPLSSQVVVFGNEGHAGWLNRARSMGRLRYDDVPVVVFG